MKKHIEISLLFLISLVFYLVNHIASVPLEGSVFEYAFFKYYLYIKIINSIISVVVLLILLTTKSRSSFLGSAIFVLIIHATPYYEHYTSSLLPYIATITMDLVAFYCTVLFIGNDKYFAATRTLLTYHIVKTLLVLWAPDFLLSLNYLISMVIIFATSYVVIFLVKRMRTWRHLRLIRLRS